MLLTRSDNDAINDIRLALIQSQPLGGERCYRQIEKMAERRESKPGGRPRVQPEGSDDLASQGELEL